MHPVVELGCQVKDNQNGGGTSLTITPSSGQVANNLLVLAISELGDANIGQDASNPGGGATAFAQLEDMNVAAPTATSIDWAASTNFPTGTIIRPSVNNPGNFYFLTQAGCISSATPPEWPQTLGDTLADGGCSWINQGDVAYRQVYLVHQVAADEPGTPTYTFNFTDNNSNPMAVRAQAVITTFDSTCLNQSNSPCASAPAAIFSHNSGVASDSTSIPTGGSLVTAKQGGAIVGAFGSDRSNPLHSPVLQHEACNDFTNGGLDMAYNVNALGNAGPFIGSLTQTIGEAFALTDGSVGPYASTTANLPVSSGSVTVTDATDGFSLTDNGSGVLTGTGGSGTIDYATGAISVTFDNPPASGNLISVNYQDLGDNSGDILSIIPKVGP
jgi:hypothetical protein